MLIIDNRPVVCAFSDGTDGPLIQLLCRRNDPSMVDGTVRTSFVVSLSRFVGSSQPFRLLLLLTGESGLRE